MNDEARLRDEIAELRADNDRLSERLGRPSWGRRGRVAAHWLALVLGGVLVLLTVLAIWTRNQVVDTDRYVRTVAPLATEPSIQQLVVDRLTAAIADPERTATFARDVLPPRAAPLATPVAAALEQFVRERIDRFVHSPDFARLWDVVSRRTHESAVALLTGEQEGRLQIAGDRLVVQLGPLVGPVEALLERTGLDTSALQRSDGDPQLVLGDASGVESARGAVRLIEGLAWLMPLFALACLAAAVALALDRRRGVLRAGLAIAGAMVALAVFLAVGRTLYLDAVTGPELPEAAAAAAFDTLLAFLRDGMRLVLAVGLVVALGAALAGPARPAVALREAVRGLGRRAGDAGYDVGPVARWVAAHRRGLEGTVAAGGVLALVVQDQPTGRTVLTIAVVCLVLVALVELVAAGARAAPAAPEAAAT